MSELNLTAQQRAAIEADYEQFTVAAAAGSGKTTVLVQRCMRLIRDRGIAPHRILAITFTNRAAAMMKRRIVRELQEAGLREAAQIAETGPIQTIHSFCERILRENALLAEIDPEFDILSETQASAMAEIAILNALTEAYENNEWSAQLIEKTAGVGHYRDQGSAHGQIRSLVRDAIEFVRTASAPREEIEERFSHPDRLCEEYLERLAEDIDPELAEEVREIPIFARLDKIVSLCRERRMSLPSSLRECRFEGGYDGACDTVGLINIALIAVRTMEEEMEAEQAFDFTELEARALRMMEENAEARLRVGSQFDAVLVDEAQDVNPTQHRLISQLGIASEMFVGDAQQSIYRFRRADRRLFSQRSESTPTLLLTENFRSSPGILSFVDTLFSRIWGDGYQPMLDLQTPEDDPFADPIRPPFAGVEFWSLPAKDWSQMARWVKDVVAQSDDPGGIAILCRGSQAIQDLSERLTKENVPHRQVGAGRFYARMEVRDLANALQAASDPLNRFAWLAMLHSPLVGLSLDSIVLLSQQTSIPEALETFVPPVEGDKEKIEIAQNWLSEVRPLADRAPAWEVLSEIIARSPLMEELARRTDAHARLANVRKVMRLAAEQPELSASEFADQIREIQSLQHREGDAPSSDEEAGLPTLMTIHKAKGLEFDTVILADTFTNLDPNLRQLHFDREQSMAALELKRDMKSFGHRWLFSRYRREESDEMIRLLYVALTRAKRRLIIPLMPGGEKRTMASIIMDHFRFPDETPPGVTVLEAEGPEV